MRASAAVVALSLIAAAVGQETPATASPPAAAAKAERPKDATALLASFAKLRGLSIAFTESKHLQLLAVPLTSSGKLHFFSRGNAESAVLVRVVDKPERSKVTITARELRMQDKHGTEVIDLRKSDRMRLFVTSLLHVFQGDRKALAKNYALRYQPDADSKTGWRLELTPKGKPLDAIVKRLVLAGSGEAVSRIEVLDANGDRTVTKVDKADPNRKFTAAERKQIFGIEPSEKQGR